MNSPRITIAATSGQGGVGKTDIVTNLAIEMARMGQRVRALAHRLLDAPHPQPHARPQPTLRLAV